MHGAIHALVKVILCPSEKTQYQVGSEEFRGSSWRTGVLTPNLIMVILRDIIGVCSYGARLRKSREVIGLLAQKPEPKPPQWQQIAGVYRSPSS